MITRMGTKITVTCDGQGCSNEEVLPSGRWTSIPSWTKGRMAGTRRLRIDFCPTCSKRRALALAMLQRSVRQEKPR